MTREELDALAAQILALPDEDLSYLWERLQQGRFCGRCGSIGWCDYETPRD